jgi:hypothetical protein
VNGHLAGHAFAFEPYPALGGKKLREEKNEWEENSFHKDCFSVQMQQISDWLPQIERPLGGRIRPGMGISPVLSKLSSKVMAFDPPISHLRALFIARFSPSTRTPSTIF